MAEVAYVSKVDLDPVKGKIRQARIPAEDGEVLFGVHSEVAEHYGVEPGEEEPHATT